MVSIRNQKDKSLLINAIISNGHFGIIIISELTEGTYKLEVTTQYGENRKQILKESRTALFDKFLTVK